MNPRPRPYQGRAMPLSHRGVFILFSLFFLAGSEGFEPPAFGLEARRSILAKPRAHCSWNALLFLWFKDLWGRIKICRSIGITSLSGFTRRRETLSERLGCLGFGFRSPVKQSVNMHTRNNRTIRNNKMVFLFYIFSIVWISIFFTWGLLIISGIQSGLFGGAGTCSFHAL